MTNRLIVTRGLPGSGKSHWAAEQGASNVFTTDDYFTKDGVYKIDTTKLSEAHGWCFQGVIETMRLYNAEDGLRDHLIVVANTNLSAAEISPYMLAASAYGWIGSVVTIDCDPELAFKRQAHGVPRHVFDRMVEQLDKDDLMPWWTHRRIGHDDLRMLRKVQTPRRFKSGENYGCYFPAANVNLVELNNQSVASRFGIPTNVTWLDRRID